MALITIVGVGPGSLDYLTMVARRAIEQAEVLIGAQRLLALFSSQDAERISVGADINQTLALIAARSDKRIAVLVTGDPGVCSLARRVLQRFGRAACQVIPGISSLQVAFARLGLDWTDARFCDVHGRLPIVMPCSLATEPKLALLIGHRDGRAWLAELTQVLPTNRRLFACQDLTLESERVWELAPAELPDLATTLRTIVVIVAQELLCTRELFSQWE